MSTSFVALSVRQPSHAHNNKTLQITGAAATAQRPMLRCWVLPQPSEPKWPASVRRTSQQNVSTSMFPWTSCLVAPVPLTLTQHLSVLHIHATLQVRTAEPIISDTIFQAQKCSKTSLKKSDFKAYHIKYVQIYHIYKSKKAILFPQHQSIAHTCIASCSSKASRSWRRCSSASWGHGEMKIGHIFAFKIG